MDDGFVVFKLDNLPSKGTRNLGPRHITTSIECSYD
jgi:hypothetical protein